MKINKIALFLALVVMAIASTSCVTAKKVRYLQDMPKAGMPLNEALEATVAPYDELRIQILSNTGKDDELLKEARLSAEEWPGHVVKIYPGNHEWNVWRKCLRDFAQLLFR